MALGLGITTELLEKPVLLTPKEQGLASSLQIWYENGKDIVLGTGSKVSRWLDQSGNDRNAAQTNTLLQPTLSKGGVQLTASNNEHMDIVDSSGSSAAFSIAQGGEFCVFMAIMPGSVNNQVYLSDSTNEFIEIMTAKKFRFKGNDGGNLHSVLELPANTFTEDIRVVAFGRDSSDLLSIWVDGTSIAYDVGTSQNIINDRGFDIANIGVRDDSDRYVTGTILELFMYNKYPAENKIENLNEYLMSKFSHL